MKRRPATGKPDEHQAPALAGELVRGCLEALRGLVPLDVGKPGRPKGRGGIQPDRVVDLVIDGQRGRFVVEARPTLRAPQVAPLAHFARQLAQRGERLLVCAERIPDPIGQELRANGIAYMDQGGNAWLHAPGLYLLVTGRAPIARRIGRQNLRGTDIRLLGVFLANAQAVEARQTELAQQAGIALGAVGAARDRLTELGILEQLDPRRWRVHDRKEGLRRFAEGWITVVRHKLGPRTYRRLGAKPGDLERRLKKLGPLLECLLGGELAAALLTGHLTTERATLHVPRDHRAELVEALALVPDEQGPVTLLDRYGLADAHPLPAPRVPALAHPLLVWAECLAVPDERVAQTAELLYTKLQHGPGK